MYKKIITESVLAECRLYLKEEEKAQATVDKYLHDVRVFARFANGEAVDKGLTLAYKDMLEKEYSVASANSMIASLNSLLRFADLSCACVKQFKVQKKAYCKAEKELCEDARVGR